MPITFIPTLVFIAHGLCMYITRNRAKIRQNLTSDQLAAFDVLDAACTAFEVAMGTLPADN